MAKQDLNLYFNEIKENGMTNNIWFFTKQSFDNMMIIYYSYIVKRYEELVAPHDFSKFYYKTGLEYEYFKTITHTEETYRNGVISECLGLVERQNGNYDTIRTTPAFKIIDKYTLIPENFEENNILFQRQIEKLVVNVNTNLRKYEEVKDVSVFMVMVLYKILLELQRKYRNTILSYEEFILFVIRVKKYSDWKQCLEYIEEFRKSDAEYDTRLKDEIFNETKKDIRFDNLFNCLMCINYEKGEYFKILDKDYMENVIKIFESSDYCKCTDKAVMLDFLKSDRYFIGPLDSKITILEDTLEEESEDYSYDEVKPEKLQIIDVPENIKKYKTTDKSNFIARKTKYLELNKTRYLRGVLAEELVYKYEKQRLIDEGQEDLANEVKWVSQELGDGLGYDIQSFQKIGDEYRKIFIEVKGTSEDESQPFEITLNEYNLAKTEKENYKIYRVIKTKEKVAKCFIIDGDKLEELFELIPQLYKAYKK